MNREHAKKLLPIIQAFADGKEVQFSYKGTEEWETTQTPQWYSDWEYRIKPKPQKVYVATWFNDEGLICSVSGREKLLQEQFGGRRGFRIDIIEREAP